MGSNPIRVAYFAEQQQNEYLYYGILAQLGEHLPYKQRVIGSSPIGPICRRGGTGRRTGLKILRDLYSRIGSIPIAGIPKEYVGIAQLDRASGYGPEGRGFESSCPRFSLL